MLTYSHNIALSFGELASRADDSATCLLVSTVLLPSSWLVAAAQAVSFNHDLATKTLMNS